MQVAATAESARPPDRSIEPAPPAGRAWAAAGWVVSTGLLVALYATSPNFGGRAARALTPPAGDFLQEWVGAYLVAGGRGDVLYNADTFQSLQHDPGLVGFHWDPQVYFPPVYPPYYYWLVRPLGRFPFRCASAIWSALLVAGLVVASWLMAGMACRRQGRSPVSGPLPARWRGARGQAALAGWVLLAAVLFPPVLESLASSQKGTLLLLAYVATCRLHLAGHPWWAGCVFGLVAVKPQLAWLMPLIMLARGQWRFVAGMATTVVALAAASLLVSPSAWIDYGRFLLDAPSYAQTPGYEQHLHRAPSLMGFWTLLLGAGDRWTLVAAAVTGLLVVTAVVGVAPSAREGGPAAESALFAAGVVATCLVSPHLFAYDLSLLLVPMWLGLTGGGPARATGRRGPGAIAAVYSAACVSPPLAQLAGVQIMTLVLAGWLAVLLQGIRRAASAGIASAVRCGLVAQRGGGLQEA